ncbi:MAG TPA: PHP domain-containing protein [Anaerolineales bacterium]|nr:PHP domain-containing protein [Anaerolineales bacterium]
MKPFRADLHVHTVLSPCADVEMIPPLIVREALNHQIDIIAITDHNASANVRAVQSAAEGTGLTVLPGMEVQTHEDIHLLCLFASNSDLDIWQHEIDLALPDTLNQPEYFGEQFVVDETGDFVCKEPRLLLTSTEFTIEEVLEKVKRLNGVVIPAHVDRKSFGLFPTLGFLADWWEFDAIEISRHVTPTMLHQIYPSSKKLPVIQSGDAHRLSEFLGTTIFELEKPTLREIQMALTGNGNRILRNVIDLLR